MKRPQLSMNVKLIVIIFFIGIYHVRVGQFDLRVVQVHSS